MTPINVLSLTLDAEGQSSPLVFPVRRMVNAGYVGRDQEAVRAHIEETAREGIPAPASVPILFPLAADNLTTADRIEVIGPDTSGEIEFVLFLTGDEMFVGVGSDHTDRRLERDSIVKSKQVCKNIVSKHVWRYCDVQAHWDDLELLSWVKSAETGAEVPYQKGCLRAILSAETLISFVKSRLKDHQCEGLVIFSGTLSALGGKFLSSEFFRGELRDPKSGRSLSVAYQVEPLQYLQDALT